jgi:UDP-N-acetylglucosamine 2-epimerase (non-hydrolysing)
MVLVHGDTFSTVLGALMGRAAGLRVGHVESGLRSFNLFHPFPEELTRLVTFRLSHTLCCAGEWAASNVRDLHREIIDTRFNTLADTCAMAAHMDLRRDHIPGEPFGIVSIHRYENIFRGRRLESIVALIHRSARHLRLLLILHPPTERRLKKLGLFGELNQDSRIELGPRYTYFDFVALLQAAELVVTDGGSIQEESTYLGLPCLLMRKATERREGLDDNVVLSGYDAEIVDSFIKDPGRYRRDPLSHDPSPSDVIVDHAATFC